MLSAEFLEANYDQVFNQYQKLLNSENYVTRRQSLKLLGELLLDRHNFTVSSVYIYYTRGCSFSLALLTKSVFLSGNDSLHFQPGQFKINDEYVEREIKKHSIRSLPCFQGSQHSILICFFIPNDVYVYQYPTLIFVSVQVFVANPNKPKPILDILLRNQEKLVDFLTKFHEDRSEDEQFNDEKAYLIKQIKELKPIAEPAQ